MRIFGLKNHNKTKTPVMSVHALNKVGKCIILQIYTQVDRHCGVSTSQHILSSLLLCLISAEFMDFPSWIYLLDHWGDSCLIIHPLLPPAWGSRTRTRRPVWVGPRIRLSWIQPVFAPNDWCCCRGDWCPGSGRRYPSHPPRGLLWHSAVIGWGFAALRRSLIYMEPQGSINITLLDLMW